MSIISKTLGLPGALVIAITIAQPVGALTLYNDSGTHNLSTPQGDVSVSNATTVDFRGASSANGLNAGTAGSAVFVNGASTVLVNGGGLIGGNDTDGGGGFGGFGIDARDGSSVVVNSGFVTGGNKSGSGFGGHGINANNSNVTVTGGFIRGGNITGPGFGGSGVQVSDGTLDISGGSIFGGQGGAIAGSALNLFRLSGSISGGRFTSGSVGGLDTLVSATDTDLDILGGVFETGKLWTLSAGSVFNVFGTGLVLTGTTSGTLTGSLQDGSDINVNYSLSGGAVINLNSQSVQVPEPGMLVLFGLGLAGLGFARHKRAA